LEVARGTIKVPAVLGFENPKALGNAIHLYIERVIGLRKFGGAGLSALWTPKNFNPMVGGGHPTLCTCGRSNQPQLGGTKIRPRNFSRGPTISASGYIRPLPSQFILSRTIATVKLRGGSSIRNPDSPNPRRGLGHPHFLECRFNMRDLGAVLDHGEPLPPSGMRSGAVASQDQQRTIVGRRRDERGPCRLSSSRALRCRARQM
jgi:hypothetical protein